MYFSHRKKIHPDLEVVFHEESEADHYEMYLLWPKLCGNPTNEEEVWQQDRKFWFMHCNFLTDEIVGFNSAAGITLPARVTSRSLDEEINTAFRWYMTQIPSKAFEAWANAVMVKDEDPKA